MLRRSVPSIWRVISHYPLFHLSSTFSRSTLLARLAPITFCTHFVSGSPDIRQMCQRQPRCRQAEHRVWFRPTCGWGFVLPPFVVRQARILPGSPYRSVGWTCRDRPRQEKQSALSAHAREMIMTRTRRRKPSETVCQHSCGAGRG